MVSAIFRFNTNIAFPPSNESNPISVTRRVIGAAGDTFGHSRFEFPAG
jgi:hypothetical protein